jgi:hypothetical protein
MDIKTQKMLADVIVNAKEKTVAPYSTTAEVKSIVDDTVYVKIPGSENATPVKASSVSVKVGDIVDLVISHSDTHITGNRSDVAVSSTTAESITQTMEASRLEMENELDIVGNKMKILNNNIDMQNNTINMQNNTITQMGNTIDQQNNTITQINNTIDQQGNTITQLNDTVTSQGNTITQINSTIETLDSTVETQGSAIQTLDSSIKIVNSAFIIQNGKLTGISEIMTNLLDSDYVTTDLLNADVAWIENGKIKQGAIGTVEIADSSITTAKIAELSADVITTGTLKTECLILTTDEVDPETGEKKVALITALNAKTKAGEGNILDGAVIKDETIEAAKITVVDLNAFGATIGNFHIGTSSMYNNKTSLNDPTNGVYIGTDGIALGQGSLLNMTDDSPFRVESDGDFHLGGKDNNYINFDAFNGKLDIKADSIKMGSSNVASESYVDQKADGITTTVEGVNERLTTMEQNADGFTWSIDQTAIVSSVNEYYRSTSATSLSGGSWSENTPTWTQGTYIWLRFKNTNGKGTVSYSKPVCITGNTGAQGATEDIEQAIEDVEVGGQNLLSDTNIPSMAKKTGPGDKYLSDSGNSSYATGEFVEVSNLPVPGFTHVFRHTCTTASSTAAHGRSLCFYSGAVVPMIDGEEYTMSMYARKTSGDGKIRLLVGYSKYPNYDNFIEVTNTWKRYSYTFTYSDSATGGSGGARAYFGASCAVVGVVETFGYKLEKGNKATDWSLSVEAGKTATNYMNFSTDGLVVGDMTASTLGKNVLIDSDSVDIRSGTKVLASYGENISLYKDDIEVFSIKDSEFLANAVDLNSTFPNVRYVTSGSTVTRVVGTGGTRTISAGTTYKWKFAIGSKTKYVVIVPTTSYSSVDQLVWVAEEINNLYVMKSTGSSTYSKTVPCVYLDENAVVDLSLNGSVWINNSGDLHGTAKGLPPLSIGANGGERLEIDSNEITAKSNDTTPSHLYLNMEGGNVSVNNNCTRSLMFQDGAIYARNTSDNVPAGVRNKWIGVVDGVNESGNTTFGYGNYINNAGDTNIYGSALNLISRVIKLKDGDTVVLNTQNGYNNIEASRSIQVANGKSYFGTSTSGDIRNNFQPCNTNNNCVIGYGSYSAKEGATNIYGDYLSLTTNLSYIMNNKAMVIPTISVYSVTTQALRTSAAQIGVGSFDSTNNQTTIGSTYFKSTNGGVRCLLSGWVKVSAQIALTGLTDGDGVYLYIYKNSTKMCFTYNRLNTSGEISIIDHVFKVAADDMIYIYGRNISAARGTINNDWYGASLTITYVN